MTLPAYPAVSPARRGYRRAERHLFAHGTPRRSTRIDQPATVRAVDGVRARPESVKAIRREQVEAVVSAVAWSLETLGYLAASNRLVASWANARIAQRNQARSQVPAARRETTLIRPVGAATVRAIRAALIEVGVLDDVGKLGGAGGSRIAVPGWNATEDPQIRPARAVKAVEGQSPGSNAHRALQGAVRSGADLTSHKPSKVTAVGAWARFLRCRFREDDTLTVREATLATIRAVHGKPHRDSWMVAVLDIRDGIHPDPLTAGAK